MRILLVEDDTDVAESVSSSLKEEGFAVDCAFDGEQGLFRARMNNYDLIILDKGLPKKDGLEVCSALRLAERNMPILILSVTSDSAVKASIINAGADDYMTKPFSFAELLARVRALLRRPKKIARTLFEVSGITIDIEARKVVRDGTLLHLTPKEFSLLEYLLRDRGQVIPRAELLEHVWDVNANPFTNTVDTHVLNLRKKLPKHVIRTVTNAAYTVD